MEKIVNVILGVVFVFGTFLYHSYQEKLPWAVNIVSQFNIGSPNQAVRARYDRLEKQEEELGDYFVDVTVNKNLLFDGQNLKQDLGKLTNKILDLKGEVQKPFPERDRLDDAGKKATVAYDMNLQKELDAMIECVKFMETALANEDKLRYMNQEQANQFLMKAYDMGENISNKANKLDEIHDFIVKKYPIK